MTEIFDDINKMYTYAKPVTELADFIEFYSETSAAIKAASINKPFTVKMFPAWAPTIWLNLGTAYKLSTNKKIFSITQDEDILIVRNETVTRCNQPADHIFTIKFFPGGLESVLGINQAVLKNRIINVSDIIPGYLLDKVKKQNNFDARVNLLQTFFLAERRKKITTDHYTKLVKDSIDFYSSSGMMYNTAAMAEKMFVTSKTINRYFNRVAGISPKKYFSIIRARKALHVYQANKKSFDPTDLGYYDMSHFYKEIVNFTGEALTAHG